MKILIYGAGVIGSLYAALLAKSGQDVTVYARGRRLESLRKNGLRYKWDNEVKKAEVKILSELGMKLSPAKMNVFRMLPSGLVATILGATFRSRFGDRFMYQHSIKAPDEMRKLHDDFYGYIGGASDKGV